MVALATRTVIGAPPPRSFVIDDGPGAYRWWYVDAVSDDGRSALVAIFFVGSVFSPYYARRLARGERPRPVQHIAVNAALYRDGRCRAWAFSEYDEDRLEVSDKRLGVARSSIERRDGRVIVRIDDQRTASAKPLRGTIVLVPDEGVVGRLPQVDLAREAHGWQARMARARVTARFEQPGFALDGRGYHDENWGAEPPARAMTSWSWGRVHHEDRTRVYFDVVSRDGGRRLAVLDSLQGARVGPAPRRTLKARMDHWLLPMPGAFFGERGHVGGVEPAVALERAPFYARFLARFAHPGGAVTTLGMGEHVDFARFASPLVQHMIALRIARPDRRDRGLLP